MSGRLHQDVETWCDTCTCEPEPRWQAVADELESATATAGDSGAYQSKSQHGPRRAAMSTGRSSIAGSAER